MQWFSLPLRPQPQSTAALPVGTIIIILLIWSVITIPLTVFGGIAGKNHQVGFQSIIRDECL